MFSHQALMTSLMSPEMAELEGPCWGISCPGFSCFHLTKPHCWCLTRPITKICGCPTYLGITRVCRCPTWLGATYCIGGTPQPCDPLTPIGGDDPCGPISPVCAASPTPFMGGAGPQSLAILKSQLQEQLKAIEMQERVMQQAAQPQTVEEADAMEKRLTEQLEQLRAHKATLGRGGGQGGATGGKTR